MPNIRLSFIPAVVAGLLATAAFTDDAASAPIVGPYELLAANNVSETITRFEPVFGFSRGQFGPNLGGGPYDIVLDPGQTSVWVSVNDGTLHQYDLGTGNELKRFAYMFNAITFGEDGKLYGTHGLTQTVQRIDTDTGASEVFIPQSSGGMTGASGLTFHDEYLYVTSRNTGEVLRFDAQTGAFHDSFASSPGNGPQHTTFGPDGNLYVANDTCGCVHRFDGDSGSFMDVFVTPNAGLTDGATPAFGPDGNFYLSTFATGIIKYDADGRYLDTLEMPLGAVGFTFVPSSIATPVPEAAAVSLWLAALGIVPVGLASRRRPRA